MKQLHICEIKLTNGVRLTAYTIMNEEEHDKLLVKFSVMPNDRWVSFCLSHTFKPKYDIKIYKSDIKSIEYISPVELWVSQKRLDKLMCKPLAKYLELTNKGYNITKEITYD